MPKKEHWVALTYFLCPLGHIVQILRPFALDRNDWGWAEKGSFLLDMLITSNPLFSVLLTLLTWDAKLAEEPPLFWVAHRHQWSLQWPCPYSRVAWHCFSISLCNRTGPHMGNMCWLWHCMEAGETRGLQRWSDPHCFVQGCRNIPWFCTHMRLYVTGQWCSCDKHVPVWTDLSALLEPTVRLKPKVPTHDKLLPASCSDWGSCLCKICSLRAYDHSCNIPFVF